MHYEFLVNKNLSPNIKLELCLLILMIFIGRNTLFRSTASKFSSDCKISSKSMQNIPAL